MGMSDSLADFFAFDDYDTNYRTESLAGLTTFLAMAYIVVVNPAILSDAIAIEGYTDTEIFQMLAIVTILSSIVATLVMAFYANRPFGLAPGMGLNAFFTYTVVVVLGVPWELALAAVFVEGVIFIALTAIGAREYVIELFPEPVKFSVGAGIGIFLLFLGLQEMELVVPYVDGDGFPDGTLIELGNAIQSPIAALSVLGLGFTFFLYARGVRGSIVIGIITTALAGWMLTLAGVVRPDVLTPEGAYDDITNEGILSMIASVQYDITPLFSGFVDGLGMIGDDPLVFALVVFTFFFVDFFDTAGTLIGVSQFGDFLDEDGDLPEMEKPLMADAVGTTVGAMVGTSTVTTYIESSTGVEEGGRTGLAALVVAIGFLLALAAVPVIAAIPAYASFIALVVVGVMMLQGITEVDWGDPAWAVSAGLTVTVMPFAYSIADGLAAGIVSYPLIKVAMGEGRDVTPGQYVIAALIAAYYVLQTRGVIL